MLDEIDDDAFNSWKHHPVTKVYLKFLADYEEALMREQIEALRMSADAPSPFALGMFKGRSAATREMASLSFGDLAAFYEPPADKQEE